MLFYLLGDTPLRYSIALWFLDVMHGYLLVKLSTAAVFKRLTERDMHIHQRVTLKCLLSVQHINSPLCYCELPPKYSSILNEEKNTTYCLFEYLS